MKTAIFGGIFFLVVVLLYSLKAIALPFLLGAIGAYTFNGLVTRLEKYKISRGISSGIIILAVLLVLVLLIVFAFPYLQQHLYNFALKVPNLIHDLFAYFNPTLEKLSKNFGTPDPLTLKTQVTHYLGDVLTWSIHLVASILTSGMALASFVSLIILTPMVMFYLLKDWPLLIEHTDRLIPEMYREKVRYYARRVDRTLSAYARAQAFVCMILMILYATSLWFIGLPQGFLIGLMTGFLSFIPYVGAVLGFFASLALAITSFNTSLFPEIFIVFLTIGLFESNVLSPRFIGSKIGLHPVWIIFSLLTAGTWFGFMGILVALPIASIIGVTVRVALEWYYTSSLYGSPSVIKKGP